MKTPAQIEAAKRNLIAARAKRKTIRQVGTDRIHSHLAMQEAGVRHDYKTGYRTPRRYESPQAIAKHGAHARVPLKQAIAEDLLRHRMNAGQQVHNALYRAKRERGKQFSTRRVGR